MSDRELGDLSACATAEAIAAGEVSASECLSFWTERAGSDRLNAFLYRRNAEAYATGDYRLWSTEGFRTEMAAERARLAAELQAAAPSDRAS